MSERPLPVSVAALRLGVSAQHVRRLIASAELEASDVSRGGASRRAWRVSPAAIRQFIAERDAKKRNQKNQRN